MTACEQHLKMLQSLMPDSIALQFIIDHGKQTDALAAVQPRLDAPKMCYRNALMLALRRSDLRYAEGYATTKTLGIPLEHAWCVDAAGAIHDPTWGDRGGEYYGVAMRTPEVGAMVSLLGYYGVFGNLWRLHSAKRDVRALLKGLLEVSLCFDEAEDTSDSASRPTNGESNE